MNPLTPSNSQRKNTSISHPIASQNSSISKHLSQSQNNAANNMPVTRQNEFTASNSKENNQLNSTSAQPTNQNMTSQDPVNNNAPNPNQTNMIQTPAENSNLNFEFEFLKLAQIISWVAQHLEITPTQLDQI